MATDRALMQQALEALEDVHPSGISGAYTLTQRLNAIEALRARLAEPVAHCGCHKCNEGVTINGIPFASARMILCPTCGNKRCPHASDHRLACTDSNEPGQAGSVYAEPEPEPVGTARWSDIGLISWRTGVVLPDGTPLYTAPPTRRPLTDEEIKLAVLNDPIYGAALMSMMRDGVTVAQLREAVSGIARAIERKITGGNDE